MMREINTNATIAVTSDVDESACSEAFVYCFIYSLTIFWN
jgi:hypothetical protein